MEAYIDEITQLRKVLHENPELSMKEYKTKEILKQYLQVNTELKIVDRESWFYAEYKAGAGERSGIGAIAFRADMDAVEGRDKTAGHYCGHDGHSAILAGFGKVISERKPDRDVYLIFQPAEETGKGAALCRELLEEKNITEIYGFHNIPGYERGKVLLRKGTFACASVGLEIKVCGTPSHAAYPEYGKNPAFVLASLVMELPQFLKSRRGMLLATVIGVEIGSDSYGVSASQGVLRLTVRGEYEEEFERLVDGISTAARTYSEEEGMQCAIRQIERFPATENTPDCVKKAEQAAKKAGLSACYLEEPMRWSEDFGYYLQERKGAFLGIGDGERYPQLHTEEFEFPDEIAPFVLKLYCELCGC